MDSGSGQIHRQQRRGAAGARPRRNQMLAAARSQYGYLCSLFFALTSDIAQEDDMAVAPKRISVSIQVPHPAPSHALALVCLPVSPHVAP